MKKYTTKLTSINDKTATLVAGDTEFTLPAAFLPEGTQPGMGLIVAVATEAQLHADQNEQAKAILNELLSS